MERRKDNSQKRQDAWDRVLVSAKLCRTELGGLEFVCSLGVFLEEAGS